MKKTPLICISIFASLLVTLSSSTTCWGQASTKTIIYDWAAKEIVGNKSLPFDEQFNFKIINLDPNIKQLQVQIKEDDGSKCNSPVDTICFNRLTTINELSFNQNRLKSVLIKEKLKPNKNYFIGFKIIERSKLTDEAKEELANHIHNNAAFTQEIYDLMLDVDMTKLNISDFNSIIYKHIKSLNGSYEVDTAAITATKKDDAQYQILQAFLVLKSVGRDILNLADNLKNQYHISDNLLAPLRAMTIETTNKCCQLKKGFSIKTFYNELDKNLKDILQNAHLNSANSAQLEKDYAAAVEDFQDEFNTRNTAIIDWSNDVLLNVIIEKTTLIIDLGTTTIDQESTTTSPYISQSFGYGFSSRTSKGLFYFSYSIFFRPINLSVPLSDYKGWQYFATRFSANLGFTLEDVETNKSGKISGLGSLFSNKAGLIGIGYRPLPFLKLDFNYMMYYMNDPNPLLNQKHFTASPLIGVSFNLNIIKIFSGQPNTLTSLKTYIDN